MKGRSPGSPAACGILARKQSLAHCSRLVINASPFLRAECFRTEYEGCTSRMVKRRNKVQASGVPFIETTNSPRRSRRRYSNQARDPKSASPTSHNRTSGPRRWASVLAHTVTVARDSGIILWTAKMPFQVELVLIRPVHEKPILRQLTGEQRSRALPKPSELPITPFFMHFAGQK